jgi:glutaredoxin-related protein
MTRWSPEQIAAISAEKVERAQESAGVLTDERIRAIADQYLQWGTVMYINANLNSIVTFARAVIAADKEPQP